MAKTTIETLIASINTIRESERISKAELSKFSREAIAFVIETKDVRPVNMLLGVDETGKAVLSPANRRIANRFFKEFTPFSIEGDVDSQIIFGKLKAKQFDKYADKVSAFLAVPDADIWSWQKDNVQMEPKPVDYVSKLTKATEKALKDGHVSALDALKAVMAGGISVDDLLALTGELAAQAQDKAA